jgi:hypothetical protein
MSQLLHIHPSSDYSAFPCVPALIYAPFSQLCTPPHARTIPHGPMSQSFRMPPCPKYHTYRQHVLQLGHGGLCNAWDMATCAIARAWEATVSPGRGSNENMLSSFLIGQQDGLDVWYAISDFFDSYLRIYYSDHTSGRRVSSFMPFFISFLGFVFLEELVSLWKSQLRQSRILVH